MMPTIRVDDEVFSALQQRAEPFVDSPNSILRRLLELDKDVSRVSRSRPLAAFVADGRLTEGQKLVWHRRNLGVTHRVTVLASGELELADGRVYSTPSAAASALSSSPQNGWRMFRTTGGTLLGDLR